MIFRFVHADGGVLTILSRRVPISDFDSPNPIYVGFNIDITALHELQLRLSRTEKLATLGQMMDRIVNQIVEYARTRELALTQFTLSDLVNEVLKLGCCRFQRHRVRCMNETGGGAWSDASVRESSKWRRSS